jgi:hypothetical protein
MPSVCSLFNVDIETSRMKTKKETSMVTITDAILHAICYQAEQIHRIKAAATKIEQIERYVYVSPDGAIAQSGQSTKELQIAGWRMTQVMDERIIEHISPRHCEWQRYRAARRQASLLLTARLILKLGGESIPELGVVRRALTEGRLANHARRGCARSLVFAAWHYLRKVENRLHRAPERFSAVEEWLTSRQLPDPSLATEQANA